MHQQFITRPKLYLDQMMWTPCQAFCSVVVYSFVPFYVFLLAGFVLKALPSELICVEFVLALPQDILKSYLEKTKPSRSIMCLIWKANSL